ncbi:DUF7342 family protein [Halospeciosus flavus]|uniref:Sugar-specific transcriptional regulator TrmB n=1 Tax=Halospeciosus flavus TaxID=3032283 RepID=A0ABD5Z3F4_9EURY|nr:sugar-specific transcriptional regulator TrmB [Halospeciosus flavus]
MSEFDPVPDREGSWWQEGTDTFDRVHDLVLGLGEPMDYTEIAALADCSPDAAKKHLDRLAEIGVAQADRESQPARYKRDDEYLECKEATQIAHDHSAETIRSRIQDLEADRESYEMRFGVANPSAVNVFGQESHEEDHDRMVAVSDWQATIRDIRIYKIARQLAQADR